MQSDFDSRVVTITEVANLCAVEPPIPPVVVHYLEQTLTHTYSDQLKDQERQEALAANRPIHVQRTVLRCVRNPEGQLIFQRGYFPRVEAALHAEKYSIRVHRVEVKSKRPEAYRADAESMKRAIGRWETHHRRTFQWKTYQPRVLKMMASLPYGRYELPTAWGKTTMIFLLASLFPKAKIHVVTRSKTLLKEIHRDLWGVLGPIGLITSGSRQTGNRVTCISSGSLHHSDFDADFVVGDEVHELALDKPLEQLAHYTASRFVGLSASQDLRADKRDFALEGLFGPLRFRVPYEEVAQRGEITPIRVLWRPVITPPLRLDPVVEKNPGLFNKIAIWRNRARNERIAKDARHFVELGKQVLVTVSTLEHALALKATGLLDGFELVWSPTYKVQPRKVVLWRRAGLLGPSQGLSMSPQRAAWLKKQFESGKLRGAIATSVWNVGVNFLQLDVVARAEGLASAIRSVQTPGRLSRLFAGKKVGVVLDYLDHFHSKTRWRTGERRKQYRLMGWEQVNPEKTDEG